MDCETCPKCQARWLEGQLYWSTGKPASELDLAGLVCNSYGDATCINPCKGFDGGDTWAKRRAHIDAVMTEIEGVSPADRLDDLFFR